MALSKITNDGVATSGLPAGTIIQTVSRTFQQNGGNATNTGYSATPEAIIDNYQTEIRVKDASSKIFIAMSIHLQGRRDGPSDAYGTIGFDSSSTTGDSKSASDYTNVVTAGSNDSQNSLYVYRRAIGFGDVPSPYGFSSTGTMTFLHTHGQSVNTYLYYTALTRTAYNNSNASYDYYLQSGSVTVTLMEVAQ